MLKISLDEGYVFDILSIYLVKAELAETPEKRAISQKAADALAYEISEQIGGEDNFRAAICHPSFVALKEANKETFLLVDEARKGDESLAKKVDAANLKRYYCKVRLQDRLFHTVPVEVKTHI